MAVMLCGWEGNCRLGGKQWQLATGLQLNHLQSDCLNTGISSGPNTYWVGYKTTFTFSIKPGFHYPSWRVMETGHPSTRVVETGL